MADHEPHNELYLEHTTPAHAAQQDTLPDVPPDDPRLQAEILRLAVRQCTRSLFAPDAFTAWLRSFSRRSACGRAGSGEASPLARFLSERCGRHVRVGRYEALICGALADDDARARYHSEASVPLPVWAQRVEWGMQHVTAWRALEVVAMVRSGANNAGSTRLPVCPATDGSPERAEKGRHAHGRA